ncbi:PB1 domain protein [Aspergillus campestris IBT 28561]|uniref:PB1 domain protein n=1 Tax=Aspergillus campestris (strain IBT 28561) TaxID=1392248 RepID=A0A2I1CZ16_ASPC2|nr:PB1 domain protein [Aspergillus campestris IBT 28561]PKY02879.1 PB1 domain protein [Aspergillus campestris IBT 28561]
MSLKQEIETWVLALEHYDNQQFDEALRVFDAIADTSKIFFNCGVIYATVGEHDKAVECYQRAIGLDQYLAIAYFQEGVSNFLLGDFEEALANFNDTLLYLRGNTSIDYDQLGLKFRLFSCEVLFNRGLCYIYLRQMGPGLQDLEYASKEQVTSDHAVINDALREHAEGYTVFSIPVGVLYRPNEAKVKNLKTKDYLGKARLIAASDRYGGPHPSELQRAQSVLDTRHPDNPPFAVSHLVQKNLTSRSRQHSEPPLNRNLFPPTPPPDADKASSTSSAGSIGRPGSLRAARPPRLDLERPGAQSLGRPGADVTANEKPRIGTTRTASEPRGSSGRDSGRRGVSGCSSGNDPTAVNREMGHRRGASDTTGVHPVAAYDYSGGEGYGGYAQPRSVVVPAPGSRRGTGRPQERYIDEEEEYASDAYEEDGPVPDGDFEMMGSRRPSTSSSSPVKGPRRGVSRRPEVHKYRVKVHSQEDTRYIIIGPTVGFREFEMRIREKFGFVSILKIKMQDEGDMITMVDQEDLDLLIGASREMARREGSEMGKMEIWVEERTMI